VRDAVGNAPVGGWKKRRLLCNAADRVSLARPETVLTSIWCLIARSLINRYAEGKQMTAGNLLVRLRPKPHTGRAFTGARCALRSTGCKCVLRRRNRSLW
jgi:hypothetical protein